MRKERDMIDIYIFGALVKKICRVVEGAVQGAASTATSLSAAPVFLAAKILP